MSKHTLSADPRILAGRKVKQLRQQGITPANVFGKGIDSLAVQLPSLVFEKIYADAGDTGLIDLAIKGESKTRPVMVHDVTVDPVKSRVLHVDFRQVNLKEKITATVPVALLGEATEAATLGNVVVPILDSVEVEALPADFPEEIQIDISNLKEVGDTLYVKDLQIDTTKLAIQTDPEEIIVKIDAPQAEEPVEASETPETQFEHGGEQPSEETSGNTATEKKADAE